MEKVFLDVFTPVINFLKEQGLWDGLSAVWERIAGFADSLFTSPQLGSVFGGTGTSGNSFLINFVKLVIAILVTLINVIMDIINWVIGIVS